ncbi:MAG: hypothetical protein ACFFD1_01000 [Candidatus Thorarchaeota archaeon]
MRGDNFEDYEIELMIEAMFIFSETIGGDDGDKQGEAIFDKLRTLPEGQSLQVVKRAQVKPEDRYLSLVEMNIVRRAVTIYAESVLGPRDNYDAMIFKNTLCDIVLAREVAVLRQGEEQP